MQHLLTFAVALALLIAPTQIGADVRAAREELERDCVSHTICAAEEDTGVCKNAGGTAEITAHVKIPSSLLFEHDQSAGNWTCDIYVASRSYTDASGAGDKINTSALTQANLAPADIDDVIGWVWASCGTISSAVTIVMTACPMN